jgi:hypothetical protein
MLTAHRTLSHFWFASAVMLAICCLLLAAKPAYAQPQTCDDAIAELDDALAPGVCDALGLGAACLATRSVSATPRTGTIRFTNPGDQAALNNLRRMITVPQEGAAVLLGGTAANPVKVLVFGDTTTTPSGTQPRSVFTLRARNGQPTCERSRSGMILQTPNGQKGTLVVNGVTINLGSTAYVVPGADVLFDQDPRIDRRQGSRNRNAPLCSGFDSDCDFGDDRCSRNARLVWGPFCQEENYPYIAQGLYRVTLFGRGEVQAGATDYGVARDYESMGTQRLRLPGSYTFCWNGLEDGGTGFETVVQPRSNDARVDHITLEYLGQDCSLPRADDPAAGDGPGEMGVLSIYNIQGGVDVSLPDGQGNSPDSGQRLRVYFQDGEPVGMDDSPTDAPYVVSSQLAQWAAGTTGSGLPEIEFCRTCRPPGDTTTAPPQPRGVVVAVTAEVREDDGSSTVLNIEATAYDSAVGDGNGDGIDYVYFTIVGPRGGVVFENDETRPAYCAFGGDRPCDFTLESGLAELGGAGGEFTVYATAYAASGEQVTASTTFALDEDAYASGEDFEAPVIDGVFSDPESSFCRGDTLTIGANVSDNQVVSSATLWWRAYSDDVEIPDFQPYGMAGGDGYYSADLSGTDADVVDYYVSAEDRAGNYSESDLYTVYGQWCGSE